MIDLIECISEIILDIQEFFFRKKRKKQRAYEKENSLPKKRMISPYERVFIIVGVMIVFITFFMLILSSKGTTITTQKIKELKELLDNEKSILGTYPEKLEMVIRNNPLRANLTKDYWNNNFQYEFINRNKYVLSSSGKDGVFGTEDDIK